MSDPRNPIRPDRPGEPGGEEPTNSGWLHSAPQGAAQTSGQGQAATGGAQRQLELVKGGHRYVFRYQPGLELKLLEDLQAMGRDPECPLSMFDAAVLSHQLGVRMGRRFEELLKG